MSEVRRAVPMLLILAAAGCNVPGEGEEDETEIVENAVTSGASYYLKLPKMTGDTNNCVAISGASLADKAFAVEWDCDNTTKERFIAEGNGTGYYRLKNVNSNKCLNVYMGPIDAAHPKTGNVDGTLVQQYTCGSGDNNYWKFVSYNGYYKIVSKLHTGDGKYRCLDVRGGATATANGTPINIWTCGATGTTRGNQTFNPVVVGSGGGDPGTNPCTNPNLVWRSGRKTHYTSYPDPGSEECIKYNGCQWAGQFAYCGTKSEAWVSSHNIAAFYPIGNMAKHNICIRSGTKTMVVTVVDTCADSDCSGCCSNNKGTADALIDLESYTNNRWGLADGSIQWADLGYNANACN